MFILKQLNTTAICFLRKIEIEIFQIIETVTTRTTDKKISIILTPSIKIRKIDHGKLEKITELEVTVIKLSE